MNIVHFMEHTMRIDERYELIDAAHGAGGFGKISKRRDLELDRLVAVKQLRLLSDSTAPERFERKARALARMSHPNVPAIYDVQLDGGQMYILFEFIDGEQLRSLISNTSPPPLERVRQWFAGVASALDHAHAKGLIHRDVKPENLIISKDMETATLVDFGIALSADDVRSLTKQGYVIGTPAYMSPEQAADEELDGRSDVYSLGITLYETLSGHLPHAGGYQPLSDANEAIPPAIDELIKECLAQDRNARIGSAQDFIKRLRSAFRTDVPLSTLLTDARLHEIAGALRQLSAEDFAAKPRGQKLLLLTSR
jgi:serine/threonine-protein kinase